MITTIRGDEVYEYLDLISGELNKKKSEVEMDSFPYNAHVQLGRILNAGRQFIKESHSEPSLDISMTGLPSVASLSPLLEEICASRASNKDRPVVMNDDDDVLSAIASQYTKDENFNGIDWKRYIPASGSAWAKQFEIESKNKKLKEKKFFSIQDDGNVFKLSTAQCFYIQGFDSYSQTVPVLIKSGTMNYKLAWNKLVVDGKEDYFALNEKLVKAEIQVAARVNRSLMKSDKVLNSEKRLQSDIYLAYIFKRRDIDGLGFWKNASLDGDKLDYQVFLDLGYAARFRKATEIWDALETLYGGKITLKNSAWLSNDTSLYGKDKLSEMMRYSQYVDKEEPHKTPKHYVSDKIRTFDSWYSHYDILLSRNDSTQANIGTIYFIQPFNAEYLRFLADEGYTMSKGVIALELAGKETVNDQHFKLIKKELKKICNHSGKFDLEELT